MSNKPQTIPELHHSLSLLLQHLSLSRFYWRRGREESINWSMGDSGDNNYSYYKNNSNKTEEETRVSEEVSRVVESVKLLHESAASFISTSSREEDALRQRARALNSTIRTLRPSIANLDSKHSDKVKISSHRMSNLELITTSFKITSNLDWLISYTIWMSYDL